MGKVFGRVRVLFEGHRFLPESELFVGGQGRFVRHRTRLEESRSKPRSDREIENALWFPLAKMSNFLTQLLLGGVVGGTLSYTLSQNLATTTAEIRSNLSKLAQSVQEGSVGLPRSTVDGTERLVLAEHVKSRVRPFSAISPFWTRINHGRRVRQWNDQIAVIASTDYAGLLSNTYQQVKAQLTPKSST